MEINGGIKTKAVGKKIYSFIRKINKEFSDFFDFEIEPARLFIIKDRKDFDLIIGRKSELWLVAFSKIKSIYILDQKKFSSDSSHKPEEFWQILKHEYSHIYYIQMIKSHYPFWLNEGLACYLSGKKLSNNLTTSELSKIFSYFKKSDKGIYKIGHFLVDRLIKKYGKEKIIKLIKSLDVKDELNSKIFQKKFYDTYGFKFCETEMKKMLL